MNVQFDDNNGIQRNYAAMGDATPKLAGWLMSKGIVKTPAAANKLQIVAALAFFALAIFLFTR